MHAIKKLRTRYSLAWSVAILNLDLQPALAAGSGPSNSLGSEQFSVTEGGKRGLL